MELVLTFFFMSFLVVLFFFHSGSICLELVLITAIHLCILATQENKYISDMATSHVSAGAGASAVAAVPDIVGTIDI